MHSGRMKSRTECDTQRILTHVRAGEDNYQEGVAAT